MLEENKVEVYMNEVYVDDEDLLMETLQKGKRSNGSKLEYKNILEEEDELEVCKRDDIRTMQQICQMVNTIEDDIQMESMVASQGEEDKLPMLEYQAWSEDKIIDGELRVILKWKFYEKFMASSFVIREESALPNRGRCDKFAISHRPPWAVCLSCYFTPGVV